ncbi:MAG: O-linked N-acetylglucosamine transferase, SPINDLY family protein [Isosphaeraceae bacterium]
MDAPQALALAESRYRSGDLAGAERDCREVLRLDPGLAPAWLILGAVCHRAGRHEEAMPALRESIRLDPAVAAAWNVLGTTLAVLGRPAEAEPFFRRALQLRPDHREAARNLGRCRIEQGFAGAGGVVDSQLSFDATVDQARKAVERGSFLQAEAWFHQAMAAQPDSADVLNDLARVLILQARTAEAVACLLRATAIDPAHARAFTNLAAALFSLNRLNEAERAARRAVEADPQNPAALNNLGLILLELGRPTAAEQAFRDGLGRSPDHPDLLGNLAQVLVAQGRAPEAQPLFARAIELRPDAAAIHSNWLLSRQALADAEPASLARDHARWELQHAAPLRSTWRPFTGGSATERPLRLGFLSAEFKRHPVGYFVLRALEGLRTLDCATFCYATGLARDDYTDRFLAAATEWRPVPGLADPELAELIRADRIDVLFDLAGHTSHNRLLLFARKPAPLQATWLGYEGTTGLVAMDYLVADRFQVREGTEPDYVERILRLPESYVCFDPPADATAVVPPPVLTAGHVTFGSFNNPSKINEAVVDAWSEILRRTPGSRLLLKYRALDDPGLRDRLIGLFVGRGIDPTRLELEGWSPRRESLAAYARVDLALDTFPYGGNTTTCEALWMGVPVVTFPGPTFASRHGLSHLSNTGLTDSLARDLADYVNLAVAMAADPDHLAALRAEARPRMAASPLCDGARFARNLLATLQVARQEARTWP